MTGMENTMIWDFVWRLVLAALFGTIIGLDREYREKEAGFRTHFLVSLGSALMMIVSQYGFSEILTHDGVSLDPSRIAAQVVSGGLVRARAALDGRDYALPDDVQMLFLPAMRHRIVLGPTAEIEGRTADDVLTTILTRQDAPR